MTQDGPSVRVPDSDAGGKAKTTQGQKGDTGGTASKGGASKGSGSGGGGKKGNGDGKGKGNGKGQGDGKGKGKGQGDGKGGQKGGSAKGDPFVDAMVQAVRKGDGKAGGDDGFVRIVHLDSHMS